MTATSDSPSEPRIIITSDTTFDIEDQFCRYQGYRVPDTGELGTIEEILKDPDWTEDQIIEAVAELNRDPERRAIRNDQRIDAALEKEASE